MYVKKETYVNDMEIIVTPSNLITFTATLKSLGVSADSNGKKYIKAGTLIDTDGAIVTQTGSTGSEGLSTTPVGVLYTTIDVTNGDMPCSLVVEGYLRADRVLDGFATAAITKIKSALPNIKFR